MKVIQVVLAGCVYDGLGQKDKYVVAIDPIVSCRGHFQSGRGRPVGSRSQLASRGL